MRGSAYRFFGTAEEYVHTIRAAEVHAAITEPGRFKGELTRIDLNRLWLQRGTESLARSVHISIPRTRSPVFILTDPEQAAVRVNGVEFKPGELLFWGRDSEQYQRTESAIRWGAMSLAPQDLIQAAEAVLGYEMTTPIETLVLRPAESAMRRLTALHKVADGIARSNPEVIAHAEAAHALEQALVHAMLVAIDSGSDKATSTMPRSSRAFLSGLEALIEQNVGRPLYLVDLCVALRTPERTLRRVFQEHLGIGPNRYLWLRRMHMAHRALQLATLPQNSVTSVAMDHGFWELGRFAKAYAQLFGEAPSATLRRPPDFVLKPVAPSYRGLAEFS